MQPLFPDPRSFKERFDPLLAAAIESQSSLAKARTESPYVHALLDYVPKLALSGGKRVRPYVAYLMYQSCGGRDERVLEALVALELFHVFALIHDDIIDKGTLRHGVATAHEFARTLGTQDHPQRDHVAHGQALLVGDLVFSWSTETLLRTLPQDVSAPVIREFYDMVRAVVVGQMLDVKTMGEYRVSEKDVLEKTLLKTAHYTFIYPLRIGQALSGMSGVSDAWSLAFGTSLGLAFQIADDLLDVVSEAEATGKDSLNDVREGQHTLLTAFLREHGSPEEVQALEDCFGKETTPEAGERLRLAFASSGAIEHARGRVEEEFVKAESLLAEAGFAKEAVEAWRALIGHMRSRHA